MLFPICIFVGLQELRNFFAVQENCAPYIFHYTFCLFLVLTYGTGTVLVS